MWGEASASFAEPASGVTASLDGGPLLVRIPNWLGDLVLALPVLEAAARDGAILLGPSSFREILAPRFPDSTYLGVDRSDRWAQRRAIRKSAPRAALLLTDSLSSAILVWSAGVPERIGYDAEGRRFLLNRVVPRSAAPRSTSREAEYRDLAEAAGLAVTPDAPQLRALPEELARGEERLAAAGLGAGRPFFVIAPGAAYGPAKQWGPERFAAVARHASGRDLVAVLVGTSGDCAAAAALRRACGDPAAPIDLTGRTTVGELIGVVARAEAVLSNDSGVMHVAAALRRPTLAIFGSTSPVWTASSAPWVQNFYAAYPCSPCFRRTCPIGYGCLRSIHADDVVREVDRLLG